MPNPSQGFKPEEYTLHLWPRLGVGSNTQLSDFAPDASNAAVPAVPEPGSSAAASERGRGLRGIRRAPCRGEHEQSADRLTHR
jgi:hypothetical protein